MLPSHDREPLPPAYRIASKAVGSAVTLALVFAAISQMPQLKVSWEIEVNPIGGDSVPTAQAVGRRRGGGTVPFGLEGGKEDRTAAGGGGVPPADFTITLDTLWVGTDTTPIANYTGANCPPAFLGDRPAVGFAADKTFCDARTRTLNVAKVTNLNGDSTVAGSFFKVCNTHGSVDTALFNIIVFDTAGTITKDGTNVGQCNWNSEGVKNVYIAGQSAPGGGIQVRHPSNSISWQAINMQGNGTDDSATPHDIVVRYLRMGMGNCLPDTLNNGTCGQIANIRSTDGGDDIILDHVESYFHTSQDRFSGESIQPTAACGDITIQYSVFGATIGNSSATNQGVPLVVDCQRATLFSNAFPYTGVRSPIANRVITDGTAGGRYQLINSAIYRDRNNQTIGRHLSTSNDGSPANSPMVDWIGSYIKTTGGTRILEIDETDYDPDFYDERNIYNPAKTDSLDDGIITSPDTFYVEFSSGAGWDTTNTRRFTSLEDGGNGPTITVEDKRVSAQAAWNRCMVDEECGVWRVLTDAGRWTTTNVQTVLMDSLFKGARDGKVVNAAEEEDYGLGGDGFPSVTEAAARTDTDGDGVPDTFEDLFGTTTSLPADSALGRYGHLAIELWLWGWLDDAMSARATVSQAGADSIRWLANSTYKTTTTSVADGAKWYTSVLAAGDWTVGDTVMAELYANGVLQDADSLIIRGDSTKS